MWHRHINADPRADAVLYSVSDEPTLAKLGLFRDQGLRPNGAIEEIACWPEFEPPRGKRGTSAQTPL